MCVCVREREKKGGGGGRGGPETLFLCFSINAKTMVTDELSMVKIRTNNQ